MSNEAFEKWAIDYGLDYEPSFTRDDVEASWQAATAESENRIAELKQRALEESNKYVAYCDLAEAKIAELKANTSQIVQAVSRVADAREAGMENKIIALQAHINVLREALEIARDYQFDAVNQFHNDFAGYKDEKHEQYDYDLKLVENALASTPAQSLQAHDNEVIERLKTLINIMTPYLVKMKKEHFDKAKVIFNNELGVALSDAFCEGEGESNDLDRFHELTAKNAQYVQRINKLEKLAQKKGKNV